jgi:hypothetical protein
VYFVLTEQLNALLNKRGAVNKLRVYKSTNGVVFTLLMQIPWVLFTTKRSYINSSF